mgnify:CR=1 FL=1
MHEINRLIFEINHGSIRNSETNSVRLYISSFIQYAKTHNSKENIEWRTAR